MSLPESDHNLKPNDILVFKENVSTMQRWKVEEIRQDGFVILKTESDHTPMIVDIYILDKQLEEGTVKVLKDTHKVEEKET